MNRERFTGNGIHVVFQVSKLTRTPTRAIEFTLPFTLFLCIQIHTN